MFKKESLLSCSVRADVTDCTQDDLAEDRMTKIKDKCGGGNMGTISLSHEYIVRDKLYESHDVSRGHSPRFLLRCSNDTRLDRVMLLIALKKTPNTHL